MGDLSNIIREFSRNYNDKQWWKNVVFISNILGPISSLKYESGDNYLDKDWDNLVIFDACRADMFEEEFDVEKFDSYETAMSPGSSSVEWMRKCFGDTKWDDIVYISANPWISKVGSNSFYKSVNIWVNEHKVEEGNEMTNPLEKHKDDLGTIKADKVTDIALNEFRKNPNKRYILHYLQPHVPCIGNRDGSVKEKGNRQGVDNSSEMNELWEAYKENLRYAYYHAQNFVEEAGGKTVYTSDHGELFGERIWPFQIKLNGHPQKIHHPKLIEVPWATETIGERRKIKSGNISEHNYDEENINKRLEDLGYKV